MDSEQEMSTKAIKKQFTLYAPSTQKSYELNPDGTLTIEGIASTTNKDLQGDIVLPSAIDSMKTQLLTSSKNLHGDHKYDLFDGIIGAIKEVMDTDENVLKIKSVIRSKFAAEIKEMLDIGINLGLSIGGRIKDYNTIPDGWEIKDIDLLEISLTGMPANWDTFGTITASNGIVESKCLNGACHVIRKNLMDDKMSEEQKIDETQKNVSEGTADVFTKDDAVDLFNELMSTKQEEIARETVTQVSKELESIIKDQFDKLKAETDDESKKQEKDEDEDDDEEKLKSLINDSVKETIDKSVKDAVNSSMGELFKDLNQRRDPNFKVDEVKEKDLEKNKPEETGLTSKEIARQVFANQSAEDIVLSLLR